MRRSSRTTFHSNTRRARAPSPVAPDVAQRRLESVQSLQRALALAYHRTRVGTATEVLIEGRSRRGGGQVCGRDPYHRVVNLASEAAHPEPGDRVAVEIVEATPHSLIGRPLPVPRLAALHPKAADFRAATVKQAAHSADERERDAGSREGPPRLPVV